MTEQGGWVPTRSGAVFAALHTPSGVSTGSAVVLVPPFGWEAMAAARNLRGWARRLAAAGHPTVRFHLPGQGDSQGDPLDQDLHSWAAALTDVVGHTRAATGCSRLTVVGLGLGGLIALQAVDGGCPVDDLVLWSTPVRGRLLLRELRAFAAMTSDPGEPLMIHGTSTPPTTPHAGGADSVDHERAGPGLGTGAAGAAGAGAAEVGDDEVLWVHGYPLTPGARRQVQELDAGTLRLGSVQRALVLGRGTLPHDKRLVAALTAQGVEASGEPGLGFDELTVEPRISTLPVETVARVQRWLLPGTPGPAGTWPVTSTGERELRIGASSAVVTEAPEAVLTAVFVGAGATPRPGPNRLWAEAARRWRDWGVASVRVDLEGIGEAGGADEWPTGPEGFYAAGYRQQVSEVLDAAVAEGLPARFVVVGLCSGGYWAGQAALTDERVVAAALLNPPTLVWPPPMQPLGPRERLRHLTSRQTWRPLLVDPVARRDALGRARRTLRLRADRVLGAPEVGSKREPADTAQVLAALEHKGAHVTLGLSPGEDLLPDVQALPPGGVAVVRLLEGPGGAHTLSPAVLRAQAEQLLDEVARRCLSADQVAQR